jgi:hypothetical protein
VSPPQGNKRIQVEGLLSSCSSDSTQTTDKLISVFECEEGCFLRMGKKRWRLAQKNESVEF